jgi:hypothetical protein
MALLSQGVLVALAAVAAIVAASVLIARLRRGANHKRQRLGLVFPVPERAPSPTPRPPSTASESFSETSSKESIDQTELGREAESQGLATHAGTTVSEVEVLIRRTANRAAAPKASFSSGGPESRSSGARL